MHDVSLFFEESSTLSNSTRTVLHCSTLIRIVQYLISPLFEQSSTLSRLYCAERFVAELQQGRHGYNDGNYTAAHCAVIFYRLNDNVSDPGTARQPWAALQ